jgi:putative SOS response-associated peptidase YedK
MVCLSSEFKTMNVMCGRYSLAIDADKFRQEYNVEVPEAYKPRYNIAPTQSAWVLSADEPGTLTRMKWGLIPHWSRDGQSRGRLFNARKEGISAKPSFRIPIRQHRCLVPADGFYEWRKEGNTKVPYRLFLKNGHMMMMAGIFDEWTNGTEKQLTFSIITTSPNKEISALHDRMPVLLLRREDQRAWMSSLVLEDALDLLKTPPDGTLLNYRVSALVNSISHDSPDLHKEVPEPPSLF